MIKKSFVLSLLLSTVFCVDAAEVTVEQRLQKSQAVEAETMFSKTKCLGLTTSACFSALSGVYSGAMLLSHLGVDHVVEAAVPAVIKTDTNYAGIVKGISALAGLGTLYYIACNSYKKDTEEEQQDVYVVKTLANSGAWLIGFFDPVTKKFVKHNVEEATKYVIGSACSGALTIYKHSQDKMKAVVGMTAGGVVLYGVYKYITMPTKKAAKK